MEKITRVACYCRVSTEEQKKHGYSISAQKERLQQYVNGHSDYMIVDFYVDDGVSAVKLAKRLELKRLIEDVKQNKIDLILFTKLDRWGRSVRIYHKIQEILESRDVIWKAIDEDYETQTSAGKFKVNIMMSVAQQERDRCSERIKDVFDYKIKNGESIWGSNSAPFGFKVENKKVVHDPAKENIVLDLINHYYTFRSKRKTVCYLKNRYDIYMDYISLTNLLKNTLLYGSYRGVENFCEPYITKEKFNEIQKISEKNIRVRKTNNTYIFHGLIKCPDCGHKMIGFYTSKNDRKYMYYRCDYAHLRLKCSNRSFVSQNKMEKELLDKLKKFMNDYIVSCSTKPKNKKKRNESKIREEIDRLNNMYLKGRINDSDYDSKYEKLEKELNELSSSNQLNENIVKLNEINLNELYSTFSDEEKQAFWCGLLEEIKIDENKNITDVSFSK